ncbi:hypothetical protein QJS66_19820 [Kocuria rhizophila]|nr:hypothetical protein QJS66_19820 [Kocuria rhizophila]
MLPGRRRRARLRSTARDLQRHGVRLFAASCILDAASAKQLSSARTPWPATRGSCATVEPTSQGRALAELIGHPGALPRRCAPDERPP